MGRLENKIAVITGGAAVERAIEAVEREVGPVDILINHAGVSRNIPFTETSFDQLDLILKTDLYGAFFCAQSVSKRMIAHGVTRCRSRFQR